MSILPSPEPTNSRSLQIAERLRAILGARRWTRRSVARAIQMSESSFSKKITGAQPFTVEELFDLSDATGIPMATILGLNEERTPSPGGDGVLPFSVRPPGLEPGTHWLTPEAPTEADILAFPVQPADAPTEPEEDLGEVIPLARRREAASERPSAVVIPLERKAAL